MPAYKDKEKGTWYASFYYEDWTGKKVKKLKRGFSTKRDALEWERTFLQQQTADLEMTFENFVALYAADMKGRIKENTWGTKEHILYKKLVPYRKLCQGACAKVQVYANRSDIPGGSTLGSIASTLVPVEMADIGLPQLAMHSCYETAGVSDLFDLVNICRTLFESGVEKSGGLIRLV